MQDSYIICATPRTGSTLLCDMLRATKVAGVPESYFMRDIDPVWAAELGLPACGVLGAADYAGAYLAAVIAAGKGETDVFGLRLMHANLRDLTGMIDQVVPGHISDTARLGAVFGRVSFIHLSRADKVAQAISMVKAEQTGLWHIAPDGSEVERLAPPATPKYDFQRIADTVAQLSADDAAWGAWFADQGITPLRIGYEPLAHDPAATLHRVCDFLDLRAPDRAAICPGVARLSDPQSRDWAARFRRDSGVGDPG
jgi:LPS sulfotransferase NodH